MPIGFGEHRAKEAHIIAGGGMPVALDEAILVVEPADDGVGRVGSGRFIIAPEHGAGMTCSSSETMLFNIDGVGLLRFQIRYSGMVLEDGKTFYQFEVASRPEKVEE